MKIFFIYTRLIFILFFINWNAGVFAQFAQLGSNLIGSRDGDEYGTSISLSSDGKTMAVSAPRGGRGYVRVSQWNGMIWVPKGNDILGENIQDYSGYSVDMSSNGNIVAIGAHSNSSNAGHVRIFEWNGTTWSQKGADIDGLKKLDYFGIAVSLSSDGDIIAIGAMGSEGVTGAFSQMGQTRIFEWNGSSWVQRGAVIDGENAYDKSGRSVSLNFDGTTVAIGAYSNGGVGKALCGHVRIYDWNGNIWLQRGGDIDGKNSYNGCGYSVSLSANGDIVAIGCPENFNSLLTTNSGFSRIYRWDGTAWVQKGADIVAEYNGEHLGHSVALSANGEMLVVGAPLNDGNGSNSGHARAYKWEGNNWGQLAEDIDGEEQGDQSGYAVDISSDGDIIAIGSKDNNNLGIRRGQVKVYTLKGFYGKAYQDFNQNCIQDANEAGIKNKLFLINPGNIIVQTDENGVWVLDSLPVGTYTIKADTSVPNWVLTCPTTQVFSVSVVDTLMETRSFGFYSNKPCPDPAISIFAPVLRPGFSNQYVYVSACNSNNGTGIMNNTYAIVELDSLLNVHSCLLPYTPLGNNLYQVDLGDLYPGQCINFHFNVSLLASATIGKSLCLSAKLFPIEPCVLDTIPNNSVAIPCISVFDNSHLDIVANCLYGDSILFKIKNSGSGDMTCHSQTRMFIDGVLLVIDSVILQSGQEIEFFYSGDGRTWRLEVDQHPNHPGKSQPSKSIELCGNFKNWTSGLVNALPQDDADPVIDISCVVVTGSLDPNDKTGFPLGLGTSKSILPNQKLEYLIRFQNTGTDTAFTIIIRDTLANKFDIFSVKTGVSSHNYTFKMFGEGVLEWTFPNIMLPDSNINEQGSHGFVKFEVDQIADLLHGTILENQVAIYFDYNAPIFTNISNHLIDTETVDLSWSSRDTIIEIACDSIEINSLDYLKTGTYYQSFNNKLYTIDLTIRNVNLNLSIQDSNILVHQVADSLISFQWVDCDNNQIPINGAIGQIFTPEKYGSYAVKIINDTCYYISDCINFPLNPIKSDMGIAIYPNPSKDIFFIQQETSIEALQIRVVDLLGRTIQLINSSDRLILLNLMDYPVGIYYVIINNGTVIGTHELLKN